MEDYNKKLINALHSVFWYDGLLEQEDDGRVDFIDNGKYLFSRPKYKEDCVINNLIRDLRDPSKQDDIYTMFDAGKICEEFINTGKFNVIWMILVEMFGSCGTSPRTGWIEKREECAEFLETIVQAEELLFSKTNDNREE